MVEEASIGYFSMFTARELMDQHSCHVLVFYDGKTRKVYARWPPCGFLTAVYTLVILWLRWSLFGCWTQWGTMMVVWSYLERRHSKFQLTEVGGSLSSVSFWWFSPWLSSCCCCCWIVVMEACMALFFCCNCSCWTWRLQLKWTQLIIFIKNYIQSKYDIFFLQLYYIYSIKLI